MGKGIAEKSVESSRELSFVLEGGGKRAFGGER